MQLVLKYLTLNTQKMITCHHKGYAFDISEQRRTHGSGRVQHPNHCLDCLQSVHPLWMTMLIIKVELHVKQDVLLPSAWAPLRLLFLHRPQRCGNFTNQYSLLMQFSNQSHVLLVVLIVGHKFIPVNLWFLFLHHSTVPLFLIKTSWLLAASSLPASSLPLPACRLKLLDTFD